MNKTITNQTKNDPISNGLKLNLGCGRKHKKGYINIDILEPCDLKHDLRKPLPFEDDSVDEIYNCSGIDLFSQNEWLHMLFDSKRVLKKGGKMEIICRDLDYVAKKFLESDYRNKWNLWLNFIHSEPKNEFDIFKNGFNSEKLINDLKTAGMENIKQIKTADPMLIHITCHKPQYPPLSMKILIGTPVNEVKDYAMERWLKNVAELEYPADLLLVDNSPGLDYVEKVKGYCKKYGMHPVGNLGQSPISNGARNYEIAHLEIGQYQPSAEKIARSREIIREKFISGKYDAWFSWECDQIIPADTLNTLVRVMKTGSYTMVHPNTWLREVPSEPNANFGCCLIRREALEKHDFMLIPPDDCWAGGEAKFKKQVLAGGGSYIELYGVITPIYHLRQ